MTPRELILASASPRRLELLRGAGFAPRVVPADIDDAEVARGFALPEAFVAALAWFKAARVMRRDDMGGAVVLAADTVCVDGDRLLGKPRDEAHARAMLMGLRDRAHRTITGVALSVPGEPRRVIVDVARVTVGALSDDAIEAYVASGAWRGKAGGYNYAERVAAGWPLSCDGDPTSVMGLPMTRVVPMLEACDVRRDAFAKGSS